MCALHIRNTVPGRERGEEELLQLEWPPGEQEQVQAPGLLQGEKVAISREILCHSSLVCFPLFRFCSTSLNCIIPTGVRQKALRALRMMLTKSS